MSPWLRQRARRAALRCRLDFSRASRRPFGDSTFDIPLGLQGRPLRTGPLMESGSFTIGGAPIYRGADNNNLDALRFEYYHDHDVGSKARPVLSVPRISLAILSNASFRVKDGRMHDKIYNDTQIDTHTRSSTQGGGNSPSPRARHTGHARFRMVDNSDHIGILSTHLSVPTQYLDGRTTTHTEERRLLGRFARNCPRRSSADTTSIRQVGQEIDHSCARRRSSLARPLRSRTAKHI